MTPARHPVWRILALWRGHLPLLALGLAVSLAGLAAAVALMAFSGGLLAHALAVGAGAGGIALLATPLLLRVLGPLRVALRYAERMVTHDATFRALADLRVWFYRGLAARSAGGLGFTRSGDVLARLVGDVEALDGLYLRILLPLAGALLLIPAVAVLLGRHDPLLAVAVAVLFALAALALPALAARIVRDGGARLARAASALRVAALDAITGLREVRAFGADGRMIAAVQAREAALLGAQRAQSQGAAFAGAGAFLLGQAAIGIVLLRAADARAVAALFLVVAAFEAIALLPRAGALAGQAVAAAVRVVEAADAPPVLADPAALASAPRPRGFGLRFEAVHFAWRADRPPVFDGLSLDIPEGMRVALLGPSGAGKSTLAALALKIAAPQSGRVLLGGVDLAALPAEAVRSRVGWLSQATHLFNDTIRANLLLGKPDAGEAELWAALDAARIADVVRALPERLDTWIGEGGLGFSGGQGRRLALARTLLSPAPVLILDEPTAGLDADTERDFFGTLNDTAAGRTVVLITHRLTGAERLHRIWRLADGRAVAAAG
ncbi:MAG: thiol reductant ABC exporter subunit CydC [Acidisphaera sp.]|nr:thiol reductant ABC exporter subunit CydC [Acidisphaera sp.]